MGQNLFYFNDKQICISFRITIFGFFALFHTLNKIHIDLKQCLCIMFSIYLFLRARGVNCYVDKEISYHFLRQSHGFGNLHIDTVHLSK